MRGGPRACIAAVALLVCVCAAGRTGEAHKPFTSPYTFNDDVLPIVRDRCGQCHVTGGVAPMSLMTYEDAVPWAQSLRLELMAGHMPPWTAATSAGRLRHSHGLTARELDVLLTWASGDTPPGPDAPAPVAATVARVWRLGLPDAVVPLPEVALDAVTQERTETFVVATPFAGETWLRAVDVQPGIAAVVRSATIATPDGHLLAQWQPGDGPVALPEGAGFRLPAGTGLVVTIRYRKTFAYDGMAMTDATSVGLYLARGVSNEAATRQLPPGVTLLDAPLRLVAIAPGAQQPDGDVRVEATRPGSEPLTLIALQARRSWARRYWFEEPVVLPRGTRLVVHGSVDLVVLRLADE